MLGILVSLHNTQLSEVILLGQKFRFAGHSYQRNYFHRDNSFASQDSYQRLFYWDKSFGSQDTSIREVIFIGLIKTIMTGHRYDKSYFRWDKSFDGLKKWKGFIYVMQPSTSSVKK